MILWTERAREDFFEHLTDTEMLRRALTISENDDLAEKLRDILAGDTRPIGRNDLRQLRDESILQIGVPTNDLEAVIAGECQRDDADLMEKYDLLDEKEVIVLPQNYRVPEHRADEMLVYTPKQFLVSLFSADVRRDLLGMHNVPSKLSKIAMINNELSPGKVIKTKFDLMNEEFLRLMETNPEAAQNYLEQPCFTYMWYGKNNQRRRVSLYRAIEGAELKIFQDMVADFLIVKRLQWEVNRRKRFSDGEKLTDDKIIKRIERIKKYEAERKRYGWDNYRSDLENKIDWNDLIEIERPFGHQTRAYLKVPARYIKGRRTKARELVLINLPALGEKDARAYAMWRDLWGADYLGPDKKFHQDRDVQRGREDIGDMECLFTAQEIASYLTMMKYLSKGDDKITLNPFVFPTEEMAEYFNKLKYQTFMIENGARRQLNKSEIEQLLWIRVKTRGYDACFMNDTEQFRAAQVDPKRYLLRLERNIVS